MEIVAERFMEGQPTTARHTAEECSLPETAVQLMFGRLIDRKLLHAVNDDSTCVTLAKPPEKITADQLIEVGFELADSTGREQRSGFLGRLRDVQRTLAQQTTLASLVPGDA